jgi:hypothetical protein
VYEKGGNTGKSWFGNKMELENDALGLSLGTAADNYYVVAESEELCGGFPKIFIFDIPRTLSKTWDWGACYQSLESIKNRFFTSTKYRPKRVRLPFIPQMLVFSNSPPDVTCLTPDRWQIYEICDRHLVRR